MGELWADKKGRLSVLFGSIILYSLANIANGFVETVININGYDLLQVWLAGELGAGITLVSELFQKKKEGSLLRWLRVLVYLGPWLHLS